MRLKELKFTEKIGFLLYKEAYNLSGWHNENDRCMCPFIKAQIKTLIT